MDFVWGYLLEELEARLDAAGVRDIQGEKIVLIKGRQLALRTTFFPLHSLRVSLLTALAFEGGVTLQALMQLAGHSRILMAIYYQKMGSLLMGEELEKAGKALAEKADRSLVTWLKQRALDDVAQQIVAADEGGLRNVIPDDSADRNPAGWLRVHGGWCLVGGNTSAPEGNRGVGGCYNGGKLMREAKLEPHMNVYEPVRERNCIAGGCRFFVTRPEYMLEIKAKLDVLLCQLTDRQGRSNKWETELDALRREKYAAEQDERPFTRLPDLNRAAQLFEKAATELNVTLAEIGNTLRLLDRCMAVFKRESTGSTHQLVAQGTITDVRLALESTDSELLQLSGICHDAEVYPELEGDVGEAVVLRAIRDPVVSSLVAFRFAEARRWKAELDTIKANTELVIDQRPRDGDAMASDRVSRMFGIGADLLPTEREALETVASDAWLHRNGLVEGADGEVLTCTGALILPIGFLAAVRKTVGIARLETVDAVTSPVESGTRR